MLIPVNGVLLLFVIVRVLTALGLRRPWFPKASVAGDHVTCATPTPVSATLWGLADALLVITSVLVLVPVALGVNIT